MKKAIISGIMIVFVVVGIVVGYARFRGGMTTAEEQKSLEKNEERVKNLMKPGQEGEANEASEQYSKIFQEKLGWTIDPKNIVSVGSPITSGKYSFTVDSWRASKENPGYALPEGEDLYRSAIGDYGDYPQVDDNGNVTNEFSYVILNVTVENMSDEPVTEHLWGYLRLGFWGMADFGNGEGDISSEVRYLGEETPRAKGHDYYKESFEAGEKKSYPVVFFIKDEILNNQDLFLQIDTSAANALPSDEEFAVNRFIMLNTGSSIQ